MSSPADYIAKAMKAQKIASERQLAKAIDTSPTFLNNIKSGRMVPSERVMLALAELAGIDPTKALLDRMTWVAKDDHARRIYARLAKTMGAVALMGVSFGGPPPAGPGAVAASPPRQVFAKETDREQIGRVGVLLYIMKHWLKSILSFTRALQAAPTI
jgi:transcriptional regulator with XRE-family HTH domain